MSFVGSGDKADPDALLRDSEAPTSSPLLLIVSLGNCATTSPATSDTKGMKNRVNISSYSEVLLAWVLADMKLISACNPTSRTGL